MRSFPVRFLAPSNGFTIPELIAILVIVSVLVAVAAPKLLTGNYNESRLYNETLAALRYAQAAAIAMDRTVCVTFNSTTQLTVQYDNSAFDATTVSLACSANLVSPAGASSYVVNAQGSAAYSAPPAVIKFDRLGRPYSGNTLLTANQTISVSGFGTSITIEAGSGYVH